MTTSRPTQDIKDRREAIFFLLVILAVMVIAYGPLMGGVWELSSRTTQAINAFVLLGVAFWDAFRATLRTGAFRPVINAHGLLLFGMSCLALATASWTQVWPFAVMGLCLNVGALLSFCFGRTGVKAFYPALAGFGVMVFMLVWVPQVDGLLRVLAGRATSWVLPVLGIRADLLIQQDPFQVFLVAEKGAGVFSVATECNGFGILLSSVLLSLILTLRRRAPITKVVALATLSVVIGLAFNIIRIVAIAAATLWTTVRYSFIHEGLGTVIYLLALLAVTLLNRGMITGTRSSYCHDPEVL